MKANEMREKTAEELNATLFSLLREQFDLRIAKAQDSLTKNHRIKDVRRSIARIKTVLSEKKA